MSEDKKPTEESTEQTPGQVPEASTEKEEEKVNWMDYVKEGISVGKDALDIAGKIKGLTDSDTNKAMIEDISKVTADVSTVEKGLSMLENLSFGKLIGGPLDACIKAQTDASKATLNFIREVGLKQEASSGKSLVTLVSFEFLQSGKLMKMQIPLITLVPIPTLMIDQVTYSLMVKLDTSSIVTLTTGNENAYTLGASLGLGGDSQKEKEAPKATEKKETDTKKEETTPSAGKKPSGKETENAIKNNIGKHVSFSASLSSKKDSKATKNSKYSIESTINMQITAVQGDMPGGIARMLEVLNNTIDVVDPNGSLLVSANQIALENGSARITVSYRDEEGFYSASSIRCIPDEVIMLDKGDAVQITFKKPGTYLISAGKRNEEVIVA